MFDIDEGMSPVYYEDGPRDDPLGFQPACASRNHGWQIARNVIRHNHDEHVLQIKEHHCTRHHKTLAMQDGQQRTHTPEEVSAVEYGSFVKPSRVRIGCSKPTSVGRDPQSPHFRLFNPENVLFRCLGEMESFPADGSMMARSLLPRESMG